MDNTETHEFELGAATGRQFAPSPYWALGYLWGTWTGMIEKLFKWQ